ncbi:GNAT family N-acetyltransferase [Patescibacteria group bacterium]|nr:MAG: GNAT family N-acetyltransferase [Patescibacteria group bacterium]
MKTLSVDELFRLFSKKEKREAGEIAERKSKEPVVKIRELQKSDRKKVLDLMNEFSDVFPPQYVNSRSFGGVLWFLNSARSGNIDQIGSFVLEVDGSVVGHISYARDIRNFKDRAYELKSVVVGASYQKMGYGGLLVRYALERLKKTEAKFVYLITRKQTVIYFDKFGFDIIGLHEYFIDGNKKRYVLGKKL